MSNFDIQYNFIAVDRFTRVAKKVQEEAKKIQKQMQKSNTVIRANQGLMAKTAKGMKKAAEDLSSVGTVVEKTAKRTNTGMQMMVKNVRQGTKAFGHFLERAEHFGDSMAFKGYIQFMNIGLPIMLAGKMGLDYADQIDQANLQLNTMFGRQKNFAKLFAQINTQAKNLSDHSRFTTAEIKATSAHIAVMTGNLKLATDLTPLTLKYAAIQGLDPAAAADKLIAAIKGGGAVAGTGMVLPQGGGAPMAQERFQILQKQLGGQLTGVLGEDLKSSTAQLHKLAGALQAIAGTILINAAPALKTMAEELAKILIPTIKFLNKHKEFSKVLVVGAIGALAMTAAVTVMGAAISAVVMPMTIWVGVVTALRDIYLAAAFAVGAFGAAEQIAAAKATGSIATQAAAASNIRKIGLARMGVAIPVAGAVALGAYELTRAGAAVERSQVAGMAAMDRKHGRTPTSETLFLGGGMGIGAAVQMPVATPAHQVDLNITVDHTGNVSGVHGSSATTNLGVNMRHSHG